MGRQSAAIGARLRQETERLMKFLVIGIDARLRRYTPVDTGYARANWVPSVGTAHAAVVVGNAAHDQGVARVLSYKLGDGDAWVTNNVPYVQMLNDGHSKQRPAGFVELAIAETIAEARAKFATADLTIATGGQIADQFGGEMAGNLASAYDPLGGG